MKQGDADQYHFDAALSFAGEDRSLASRLARLLKAKGWRVFYDKDHRARLWGKRSAEYEGIYGPRSRFVIPLVSEHYVQKDWTMFEFESAKREARRRTSEFILPIRIDDTRLFGLSDDVNYLSVTDTSIREIADEFARKCEPLQQSDKSSARRKGRGALPRATLRLLLSGRARRAFGLIATASGPMKIADYKRLFPDIDWSRECRHFRRMGLIKYIGQLVIVKKGLDGLYQDEPEGKDFNDLWIGALSPVRDHVDTALFPALNYLRAGRLNELINGLADITEGMNLGRWNKVYLTFWSAMERKASAGSIGQEERCRLYNSTGICLSGAGRHQEALDQFEKLRAYSRQIRSTNWVGQSLINAGVAYSGLKDREREAQAYRKAIEYGRKSGDNLLVSRAQGNLAGLLRETAPDEARQLLTSSLRTKLRIGDDVGAVVARVQLAQVQAVAGDPRGAIQHYVVAKEVAEKLDIPDKLALILHDLGSAYYDIGRPRMALRNYRRAYRLASRCGYRGAQAIAAMGEGRVCFEAHRIRRVTVCFP